MPDPEKDTVEELRKKLFFTGKSAWEHLSEGEKEQVFALGREYRDYLSLVKTERETIAFLVEAARKAGFTPWEELSKFAPGVRFFRVNRGKAAVLGVGGQRPLRTGLRLVGAHVDAPRLDLKPRPLYEEEDLALLKTHYYGGIKKYQWTATPLALHGVVVKSSGEKVEIILGEREDEPVFTITDLLPHLARKQREKKLEEAIRGEELNVLAGQIPFMGAEGEEKIKFALLHSLYHRYGITEEDLVSADLEVVPAGKARDLGFDQSFTGGYGQDDRACVFAALKAILGVTDPPGQTALALFVDKEEIGSMGNTGAQSSFLGEVVTDLLNLEGDASRETYFQVLGRSRALSADVEAALDPTFKEVTDKYNALRLGYGVVLTKYTGSGGKQGASEAHAEYFAWLRALFHRAGVVWQTGEMGKVDEGGGGTIAQYLANQGLDVADCGPPLLSMHSPFEISSKVDLYFAQKAYRAFFTS